MRTLLLTLSLLYSNLAFSTDPFISDPAPDAEHPAAIEEVTLLSEGHRLPGLIYLASGAGPHPTVVLLHGLPGNEKNLDLAQLLRRAGFNVLFFHYRGAWGAEGQYALRQLPEDTQVALSFLRDTDNALKYRVDTSKLSLLGHSLGGYTALRAGSLDADLACVGAMAPANLGLYKAGLGSDGEGAARILGYADTLFMLRGFSGTSMEQELRAAPMAELDTRLFGPGLAGKHVFLVTGQSDTVTPPEVSYHPLVAAYQNIDGLELQARLIPGDHSFSTTRVQLARLLLGWYGQYCR